MKNHYFFNLFFTIFCMYQLLHGSQTPNESEESNYQSKKERFFLEFKNANPFERIKNTTSQTPEQIFNNPQDATLDFIHPRTNKVITVHVLPINIITIITMMEASLTEFQKEALHKAFFEEFCHAIRKP